MARETNPISVNVVREEPAPCRLKLDVEVLAESVDAVLAGIEREFRKQARIPGFRPGKAPRALLKRHYGPRILEDAKDRLLRDATQAALKDQDVAPLTVPQVENEQSLTLVEGRDFVFAVEFDIAPAIELPDYKSLHLPVDEVGVGDQQVEDFIASILSRRASYDTVERPAQAGDMLKATYQATLDEDSDVPAAAKFIAEGKETWVSLNEPEILPGIAKRLVGVEAGQSLDLEIEFPEDFYEPFFAGRKVPYHFDVLEVLASSVPELTDELAQKMGGESAEDVRERVRVNLEGEKRRERAEAMQKAVVDQLLDKVDFPLPPSLLAHESYEVLRQMYSQAAQATQDREELKGQLEAMRNDAEEQAKHNLRRRFLLEKIAEAEQIKIKPQEVDATIGMMAAYQQVTEKKLLQRLRESGRLHDLLADLLANRTLQHIIQLNAPEGGASDAEASAPNEARKD